MERVIYNYAVDQSGTATRLFFIFLLCLIATPRAKNNNFDFDNLTVKRPLWDVSPLLPAPLVGYNWAWPHQCPSTRATGLESASMTAVNAGTVSGTAYWRRTLSGWLCGYTPLPLLLLAVPWVRCVHLCVVLAPAGMLLILLSAVKGN